MSDLHVFHQYGAGNWVVAKSEDDAWAAAIECWGGKREDFDDEGQDPFVQLPDDKPLKIICDENGDPSDCGKSVSRTCEEWASRQGRGWLATENF